MNKKITDKIQELFPNTAIYKDPQTTDNLFTGRNLPSFVKDYLLRHYMHGTEIDKSGLNAFLDKAIPSKETSVKDKLSCGEVLQLLTRFDIYIDIPNGIRRFTIPDIGIKISEGRIPDYVYNKHNGELVDGEKWGIVKLCVMPNDDSKKYHVEMVDYKPFKPFKSVDVDYWCDVCKSFTLQEWIDILLSSMEYEPDAFASTRQKMEMLSRLLIFVEPRLNVIELAPKGTGKSYVYGNLSKYGWLVSGGKVTRSKLFYDKQRQQNGIMKNHDFTVFDEIQTIAFQEPAEIQAALKSYLESGKTTIDNFEFTSECGLMLMGNIQLTSDRKPVSRRYFDALPQNFRESALLDRFHCFIEGWYMPRVNKNMIYKGWSLNTEYFSEILHTLRISNRQAELFDQLVEYQKDADMRDFKAVKKIATAYMKLLFPYWSDLKDVDKTLFNDWCLQPALTRRGIIKAQCHNIDPEFKTQMPDIHVRA